MKKWLIATALMFVVSGCTEKETMSHEEHDPNNPSLEIVEVEILNEDQLDPGTELTLSARVTQEDKVVDDADEVKFEVWESGLRDEGQMYEGSLTEDGVYEAKHLFEEEGVYYMFAHTTARGMHVMPKMKITVGNPDPADVLEDDTKNTMNHK